MQIKTVTCPIENAEWFDSAVNNLLSEGWTIKKRDLLNVPGTLTESFNVPLVQILYAELEKNAHKFEEITL